MEERVGALAQGYIERSAPRRPKILMTWKVSAAEVSGALAPALALALAGSAWLLLVVALAGYVATIGEVAG